MFKKSNILKKLLENDLEIDKKSLSYTDRDNNNILHLSVIHDKPQIIKELKKTDIDLNKTNIFGLTPVSIAKFLNRKKCIDHLDEKIEKIIKVEKDGEIIKHDIPSFEKLMEIEYIHYLEFENYDHLVKIIKDNKKAVDDCYISKDEIWHGHYYSKEMITGYHPDVSIKWIDCDYEYGLFTNEDLPPKTFAGEYSGYLRKRNAKIDRKNDYCFEYQLGYEKTTPFTIDAREKGNLARFINHNKKPNLTPVPIYAYGFTHIVLLTNQFIKKDTQLSYDYGPSYWAMREEPL
jgi:uncharacterized protein